jgi:cell division protein FtsQ
MVQLPIFLSHFEAKPAIVKSRWRFSCESIPAMARKANSEDEPASRPRATPAPADLEDVAAEALDSRQLELESETEAPFLRSQKRIPVRRGPLPKKAANRLKYGAILISAGFLLVLAAVGLSRYGRHSWRFRLESSDQIQLAGNRNVSRGQVLEIFGGDISRNIFLISLEDRKRQLEQIPWIESATVMRLLPNRLSVEIHERTPLAYAQVGSQIKVVDNGGVLMDTPPGIRFAFPVILGFTGAEPLSTRSARVRIYQALMRELDSGGNNYSHDINEVDLADPEDVKVTVTDERGEVLIHLGASAFLDRYKVYIAHIREWRQQFQQVYSVDLRYDRQVIVNPDAGATPKLSEPAKTDEAGQSVPAAPSGAKKPRAMRYRQ